jgi:hypothetical protein
MFVAGLFFFSVNVSNLDPNYFLFYGIGATFLFGGMPIMLYGAGPWRKNKKETSQLQS